ncbi:MAG TPA: FKBP-type peptidyl-prolyl cis-trans isomerase, partial [candidate division Zixibacteria bacterium]|nr:FKBP-type peptidyl-prolyl cis-trans isomerase [candidate division Zixibacteria bacterium]
SGTKGKLIQTSKESTPLNCTIGVALIAGWSEGMLGMKEGGTRELIVPPAIGYGASGRGNMIPPNSTLYFEIEFLNEVKQ